MTDRQNKGVLTSSHTGRGVGFGLIGVAALAWIASYLLMGSMTATNMEEEMMGSSRLLVFTVSMMFSSLNLPAASLFLLTWIAGMVAMMFPALIPIVSLLYTTMEKRGPDRRWAKTGAVVAFLTGYLALYAALGLAAYLVVFTALRSVSFLPTLSAYATAAAIAVLFASGLWQLTSFKNRCLKKCVSPLGFLMNHSRRGLAGALRMGAEHGYFCVGCCYMYMFVMLAVAAMSLPAMALLAVVVTLEKVVVKGAAWFSRLVAAGFMVSGAVLFLFPSLV